MFFIQKFESSYLSFKLCDRRFPFRDIDTKIEIRCFQFRISSITLFNNVIKLILAVDDNCNTD